MNWQIHGNTKLEYVFCLRVGISYVDACTFVRLQWNFCSVGIICVYDVTKYGFHFGFQMLEEENIEYFQNYILPLRRRKWNACNFFAIREQYCQWIYLSAFKILLRDASEFRFISMRIFQNNRTSVCVCVRLSRASTTARISNITEHVPKIISHRRIIR